MGDRINDEIVDIHFRLEGLERRLSKLEDTLERWVGSLEG